MHLLNTGKQPNQNNTMGRPNIRATNLAQELEPVVADHQTLAVTDTATGTDSVAVAAECGHVQVQVETAAVRVTINGTTPTPTLGTRLTAGQLVLMSRAEWAASKWVREGGTSALLQVAQYN